jgi:hypothetical protein
VVLARDTVVGDTVEGRGDRVLPRGVVRQVATVTAVQVVTTEPAVEAVVACVAGEVCSLS